MGIDTDIDNEFENIDDCKKKIEVLQATLKKL